jgi:acyl carrier protein
VETLNEIVLGELRSIARSELDFQGTIEPAMSLTGDLHLDSMAMIIVAICLENHFQVCLDEEDAGALVTVGDLVALVCRRVTEEAS